MSLYIPTKREYNNGNRIIIEPTSRQEVKNKRLFKRLANKRSRRLQPIEDIVKVKPINKDIKKHKKYKSIINHLLINNKFLIQCKTDPKANEVINKLVAYIRKAIKDKNESTVYNSISFIQSLWREMIYKYPYEWEWELEDASKMIIDRINKYYCPLEPDFKL